MNDQLKHISPAFPLLLVAFISLTLTSCHVGRYFFWNFADINDYKKFPTLPVEKASDEFSFEEKSGATDLKIPQIFEGKSGTISLSLIHI